MVTDVVGWRLDDVVQLIRGKAGTVVKLQVLPAGAAPGTPEKMLVFTRNKVNLENQAATQEVRTVTRGGRTLKIGVITIPSFYQDVAAQNAGDENYRSTTRDVLRLLGELKTAGVDGMVLDLRDDGGGYLPEATAAHRPVHRQGPGGAAAGHHRQVEVLDDPDAGVAYAGPLAVLVDRYSARASEIFAGALQDYHRAYILGQTHLRQGHGAEPDPARPLVAEADERPDHGDHRQVLSRDRREHAASRRRAGRAAALGAST